MLKSAFLTPSVSPFEKGEDLLTEFLFETQNLCEIWQITCNQFNEKVGERFNKSNHEIFYDHFFNFIYVFKLFIKKPKHMYALTLQYFISSVIFSHLEIVNWSI
jgi:hypothetical protein